MLGRLTALGVVLWWFVVPQLRGAGPWSDVLPRLRGPWVAVAVVAEIGSLVLYTLATRALLAPATRPPYSRVARIDLSAIALGHCLPDGGAAGTALCWRLLVADGVASVDAALTKVAQGVASAVVLLVLVVVGLAGGAVLTGGLSTWAFAPGGAALIMLAGVALVGLSLASDTGRVRLLARPMRLPRLGPRLSAAVGRLHDGNVLGHLRTIVTHRPTSTLAVGFSAGNWALDAFALWAALHAYGHGVGLQGLAVVYAIAALGTWLPITPSGLGLSESVMIPALLAFGALRADAVLGLLTWRLVAYWLPIPLGAVAYATLGRRRRAGAVA
jgi:hypothetical protein